MNRAATLMDLLGLSEDELCQALASDPLQLVSGEVEHRPELPILLQLSRAAEERVGAEGLRRWLRASGPRGRPVDALMARDFERFEAAVEELVERGFVLRKSGR
jgi:hypothetical protein